MSMARRGLSEEEEECGEIGDIRGRGCFKSKPPLNEFMDNNALRTLFKESFRLRSRILGIFCHLYPVSLSHHGEISRLRRMQCWQRLYRRARLRTNSLLL